ncbi:GAF domain-containing protein [Nitrospiraceae bacterium HYJII51-Mn-bac16s-1-B09]|uniref:histidine kinase n=2 Tax=Candidatus Manganitrophus noduliformans TaxID=2606439 RepID=A0A7X6DNK9_9BACT|nr:GAF domain-containing protein [Candidatus Manganitrophus noduliformans]
MKQPAARWILPQPGEEKRVTMAKTAGLLYFFSTAVVWTTLHLFPQSDQSVPRVLDLICLISAVTGCFFLMLDWRRLSIRVFYFTTVLTLFYIAGFVFFSGGAASPYAFLYFLVIFWSSFFLSRKENLTVMIAAFLFTLLPFSYDPAAFSSNTMTLEGIYSFFYFPIGWIINFLSSQKEEAYQKEKATSLERARFASHLETLQQISSRLTAESELDRLIQLILFEGLRLLDFEVAGFLLWRKGEEAFVLRGVANLPPSLVGQKFRRGEGLVGRVAEEKKIVLVYDDPSLNSPIAEIAALQLKTYIGIPIFWKGEVIGAFNMATSQPNKTVTDADRKLGEMLAQQAAVAIENTRLFQQSVEQARRQALLYKVVSAVSSNLPPQEILHRLAQIAAETVHGTFSVLLLKQGEEIVPKGAYQVPPVQIPFFTEAFKIATVQEESPGITAIRERRVVTIPELQSERTIPLPLREEATRFGFLSLVAVPLLFQEESSGALVVYSGEAGAFRPHEIEILSAIASEAATAVHYLKWLEERDRHLARTEALREIAQEIGAQSNWLAVLDLVVQRGCSLMEMEKGGIVLQDRDGASYVMQVSVGPSSPEAGERVAPDEMIGPILREKKNITIEDHPDFFEALPLFRGRSVQSAIGTPILVKGEAVGVLFFLTAQRGRSLSREDGKTIEILARYASIAIENERLHAETAALHERFALLTKEISLSRNLDQVFFHIAEGLKRHVSYSRLSIGFRDESLKEIQLLRIEQQNRIGTARWPQEQSAIDWVLAHQRPLIRPDLGASQIYVEDRFLFEEGIRSYAILPVVLKGVVIATLNLKSDRPGAYSDTLIESLLPFANHLAPFIENARLFQELTHKKREAEEASRLKTEFLSNVSHELRTPLNAVIGYTHLLQDEIYGPLRDRQKEPLSSIRRNAASLLSLINNLLDLSKIEAGKIEVNLEEFDLEELLQEVFENVKPLLHEKAVEVHWRLAGPLAPLWSDPQRVRQIFLNLFSNAIKFTDRGSITISAANQSMPRGIVLSVEDTGIGMREEDLPSIFDPFRQVDGSLTRSAEGTGLGLTIVKKALNLIEGTIEVESAFGKGSRFTVFLPHLATKKDQNPQSRPRPGRIATQ